MRSSAAYKPIMRLARINYVAANMDSAVAPTNIAGMVVKLMWVIAVPAQVHPAKGLYVALLLLL